MNVLEERRLQFVADGVANPFRLVRPLDFGKCRLAVLICSSLTMVMAVHYAKEGNRKLTAVFLLMKKLMFYF